MNWALNIRSILQGCSNKKSVYHLLNTEALINGIAFIEEY